MQNYKLIKKFFSFTCIIATFFAIFSNSTSFIDNKNKNNSINFKNNKLINASTEFNSLLENSNQYPHIDAKSSNLKKISLNNIDNFIILNYEAKTKNNASIFGSPSGFTIYKEENTKSNFFDSNISLSIPILFNNLKYHKIVLDNLITVDQSILIKQTNNSCLWESSKSMIPTDIKKGSNISKYNFFVIRKNNDIFYEIQAYSYNYNGDENVLDSNTKMINIFGNINYLNIFNSQKNIWNQVLNIYKNLINNYLTNKLNYYDLLNKYAQNTKLYNCMVESTSLDNFKNNIYSFKNTFSIYNLNGSIVVNNENFYTNIFYANERLLNNDSKNLVYNYTLYYINSKNNVFQNNELYFDNIYSLDYNLAPQSPNYFNFSSGNPFNYNYSPPYHSISTLRIASLILVSILGFLLLLSVIIFLYYNHIKKKEIDL